MKRARSEARKHTASATSEASPKRRSAMLRMVTSSAASSRSPDAIRRSSRRLGETLRDRLHGRLWDQGVSDRSRLDPARTTEQVETGLQGQGLGGGSVVLPSVPDGEAAILHLDGRFGQTLREMGQSAIVEGVECCDSSRPRR
jgi:hypothetical protein